MEDRTVYSVDMADYPVNKDGEYHPNDPRSRMVHIEEMDGEWNTLEEVMEACRKHSESHRFNLYDKKPFPLHLYYIRESLIENGEREIIQYMSYDEWEHDKN